MFKLAIILILLMPLQLKAQYSVASIIGKHKAELYYPLSVKRFYKQNNYQLAWIAPDTVKMHAWDALLLLDCVLHYGLNPADYHPVQLRYEILPDLIKQKTVNDDKVLYDILLTDAMISFMNNLHYGKLNPVYSPAKIDKGTTFKAVNTLQTALQSHDFSNARTSVQPRSVIYTGLQQHMRLLVGQQSGDCYILPEALIRKMAINMERLRWISTTGKQFYLTLIVNEGIVINYEDINKEDENLEKGLYGNR